MFFLGIEWRFLVDYDTERDFIEREFSISLRMTGVPRNVVITSDLDSFVRFTVRDKGYMIAFYGLDDTFHPLYIDYKAYSDGRSRGEVPVADLQRQINLNFQEFKENFCKER